MISYDELPIGPAEKETREFFEQLFFDNIKTRDDLEKQFPISIKYWKLLQKYQEEIVGYFNDHGYKLIGCFYSQTETARVEFLKL